MGYKSKNALICSSNETPFENGTFKLNLQFNEEYLKEAPLVRFHIAPLVRSVDLYDNICVFKAYKSTFIVFSKSTMLATNLGDLHFLYISH